jgi:hypothetical protein
MKNNYFKIQHYFLERKELLHNLLKTIMKPAVIRENKELQKDYNVIINLIVEITLTKLSKYQL